MSTSTENQEKEEKKIEVLSFDDDNDFNKVLALNLEKEKIFIKSATTLEEFKGDAKNIFPSLYLIDLNIGENAEEGLKAIEFVKSRSELTAPIYVLSAETTGSKIVGAMELGADDFLAKPIDYNYLIPIVKSKLGHSADLASQQKMYEVMSEQNECLIGLRMDVDEINEFGIVFLTNVLIGKGTALTIEDGEFNKALEFPKIKIHVGKTEYFNKKIRMFCDYVDPTPEFKDRLRRYLLEHGN